MKHVMKRLSEYLVSSEPFYKSVGSEVVYYEALFADRTPVILKGPTGSGKTRFMEYMAHRLKVPLLSVSCHEDMTASDLLGRFLLDKDGTIWRDGPLTLAVRGGAICYLDEIVEARQDTSVVIHSLTDHRRMLFLEKKNEAVTAHENFHLVVSYNPGYQNSFKDLKESTKQRFAAINFQYPEALVEAEIVSRESNIDLRMATKLVQIAGQSRNLRGHGLEEGCSTRMLIHVARLLARGIPIRDACDIGMISPLTDDDDIRKSLNASFEACI